MHFENGFLGKSMKYFLSDSNLWNKSIEYYLDKEPESIFVVENEGKIFGYVLGCIDDKKCKKNFKTFLSIFKNYFKSFSLPKKDRLFWKSRFLIFFNNFIGKSNEYKFKVPKNAGHFHINVSKELRGKNFGSELLKVFEEYAKEAGVEVLHADGFETGFNPNTNFWFKNGFKIYSKVDASAWAEQLPERDVKLVCYFKKLKN